MRGLRTLPVWLAGERIGHVCRWGVGFRQVRVTKQVSTGAQIHALAQYNALSCASLLQPLGLGVYFHSPFTQHQLDTHESNNMNDKKNKDPKHKRRDLFNT